MKSHIAMPYRLTLAAVMLLLLLSGCSTRSISDSGYRNESGYRTQATNPFYRGELREFDVLGIKLDTAATQEEIKRALESKQQLALTKGTSLMLIQSGAVMPDEDMLRSLERYYNVAGFSGVPVEQGNSNYASSLRLAAAKGGCEKILVYWGLLETAQTDKATKIVSWVPVLGGIVPDESQEMRIRLKFALIDVKSGQWTMFSPEPFQDTALSARYTRESSDQEQVGILKAKAYAAAAEDIVKKYSR